MDEENNNEISEFLKSIDSISEPIAEHNIANKIKSFAKEKFGENIPDILLWEQMAFDLVENYTNKETGWGTYFGPFYVLPNEQGQMMEYPSIQLLTPEIINYWEKRAKKSTHPILKARYSNLVWDFSEKITGKKPSPAIAQIFIDAVIEIAEKNLHKYERSVITKLERALSLALSINDKERLNNLIDTIISYERKIAEDDKPGLWGFSYELLFNNKKIKKSLKDKEQIIINDLEQRFNRLLNSENQWAIQRATLLLVDYYSKLGNKEKIKELLLKFGELVQKQLQKEPPFSVITRLEQIYHLYLQHGLKDEANKISLKIKELSKKTNSELKPIETSIEIPIEKIKEYIDWLVDGDIETVLMKISINYIPKKDEVVKELKDISKNYPIQFLFTHKIIDIDGHPIATIGSIEEDLEGHVVKQISQDMSLVSFLLRETIDTMIKKFGMKAEEVIDYLYKSPIFEEERKEIIIKGIESYLKGDFISSLHLLIPQIEAAIRNLAEKIGVPILKPSRTGGFFYRTLDELLREKGIIQVFSEDMCLYFRVLFTDPRGWNLRNNVCHGIGKTNYFNHKSADRVFHALLCLGTVRKKEEK